MDSEQAFFVSASARTTLPQLLHALRSDLGIAVLTGPAGVGRTAFLRHLRSVLSTEGRPVLCSGASLESSGHLLTALAAAAQRKAGDPAAIGGNDSVVPSLRGPVTEQLRRSSEFWGPVLLLIDDVQFMPVSVLNDLRALTEESWSGRSLVRCLISGPLSFEEELARADHADFSRRIRCHAFLKPLAATESVEFLDRHLTAVGGKLREIFSTAALELLVHACDGLPRCLSLLADESLVVAAEAGHHRADEDCVRTALGRLQHLPYSWSASPIRNESFRETEEDSVSGTPLSSGNPGKVAGKTEVVSASGFIEFGAPVSESRSVVEFGSGNFALSQSQATVIPSEVLQPAMVQPVMSFAGVPEAEDWDSDTGEVSGDGEVSADDPSIRFESPSPAPLVSDGMLETEFPDSTAAEPPQLSRPGSRRVSAGLQSLFEVGRRFSASKRAAEMSDKEFVDVTEFVELEESEMNAALPDCLETDGAEVSDTESSGPATTESADRFSVAGFGQELSQRVPVFDRYTWLSLGREVPSGTYSVSSTLEMHRLATERRAETVISENALNSRTTFDSIPVSCTSDAEILASLTRHLRGESSGDFIAFCPPDTDMRLNSTVRETVPGEDFLPVPALAVVGVEVFGSSDTGRQDSSDVHASRFVSPEVPVSRDIRSDQNREVIETAIRTSLSTPEPSDAADLSFAGDSSLRPRTTVWSPVHSAAERSWQDGRLVYADSAVENLTVSPDMVQPSGGSGEDVIADSLPVSVPDAAAQPDPETQIPEPGKFFTLPLPIRSAAWDLRSEFIQEDEVAPLAQSLADLRHEVDSFHLNGRTGVTQEMPSSRGSHIVAVPFENLLTQARRRLDEQVQVGINPHAPEPMIVPSSSVRMETELAPSDIPTEEPGTLAVGPSPTDAPSRFGRLFTRLRQQRRQSTGDR